MSLLRSVLSPLRTISSTAASNFRGSGGLCALPLQQYGFVGRRSMTTEAPVTPNVVSEFLGSQPIVTLPDSMRTARPTEEEEEGEKWYTTSSKLRICDVEVGKGELPSKGQSIHIHYSGWLEDGTEFANTFTRGQTTPLKLVFGDGSSVQGFREALSTMRVGGKRKIEVPSWLGYGKAGCGHIPPGATLYFAIEVKSMGPKPLYYKLFGDKSSTGFPI